MESYTSGGYVTPAIWVQQYVDLSPYAGNIIRVRFMFNTGDQLYNGYRGWVIDDISVSPNQIGTQGFGRHTLQQDLQEKLKYWRL